MKSVIEFKGTYGPVCVPTAAITGIVATAPGCNYPTFVATGADSADGRENGWYIIDEYDEAKQKLTAALEG